MTTTDLDTIRELVQSGNYRTTGKTGEQVPPANRKVELCKNTSMKVFYVDSETWRDLCDSSWFAYDA